MASYNYLKPVPSITADCRKLFEGRFVCVRCADLFMIYVYFQHIPHSFTHIYVLLLLGHLVAMVSPCSAQIHIIARNSLWATPFLPSPISKFTVNDKLRQYHTTSKTPARKMSPVLSFHKPSFSGLGFPKSVGHFLPSDLLARVNKTSRSLSCLLHTFYVIHQRPGKQAFFCICKSRPHCCFSRVTLPCTSFRFQMWRHSSCAHFERIFENLNNM